VPFGGDFTLNYNFQAPYYAAASSNRLEVMAPFFDVIVDYMAKGEQMAADYFGCPGVHYPGHIGPWGMTSTDVGDMGQRSDAVFAALIFAHRYMYSLDDTWLKAGTCASFAVVFAVCWAHPLPHLTGRRGGVLQRWACCNGRRTTS
jgi:hypothetical protein